MAPQVLVCRIPGGFKKWNQGQYDANLQSGAAVHLAVQHAGKWPVRAAQRKHIPDVRQDGVGAVKAEDAAVQAGQSKWGGMPPLATHFYNAKTSISAGFTPYVILYSDLRGSTMPKFGDNDDAGGITSLLGMRQGIRAKANRCQE